MNVAALIVAAGRGERAGGATPKQYATLLGKPVLRWSIEAFAAAGVDSIVIVVSAEHEALCNAAITGGPAVRILHGGPTRTASVRAGLAALGAADIVLVHDAARPGLCPEMVRRLIEAVQSGAAGAAPALPVTDTLRRVDAEGAVLEEVARDRLMCMQTPQAFRGAALRAAYAALPREESLGDDLAVMHRHGGACVLIAGDARLAKITYADDLVRMERVLSSPRTVCVGHGVDAHRFGPGDGVTICGVRIDYDRGLLGHSDADAGWHALVDAILGALGEGDIGAHFPPSDPQWKGASSEHFLRRAKELAETAGASIMHVDVTVICEQPKIAPYREAMRSRTAGVLGLPPSRVSVKATTTEGMGFLGRQEGVAAHATATLERFL